MLLLHFRCSIDWKKGKNLTVKTIKKKQKTKSQFAVKCTVSLLILPFFLYVCLGKGQQARTVLKTVSSESFFNIFSPPTCE